MNRFPLFRFLFSTCTGLALMAASALATSIRPPSFEQLVELSGKVVRATVEEVRPYEDSYEGEAIVRTEVTLNVLQAIAGDVDKGELKIEYLGGQIGNLRMEVGAMPKFEVGKEVVLFLHPHGRFICPTVGWGHGKYQVDRNTTDGVARIRRSNGRMLQELEQVEESMHSHGETARSLAPRDLEGMTLAQFVASVRLEVEDQSRIR